MAFFDFFKYSKDKNVKSEDFSFWNTGNDNSVDLNSYLERYNTSNYIWFGDTNQYPNYLNNLYNSSGLHSAIIDFEQNFITGSGYTIEGEDSLTPMEKVDLTQFLNFFDGTNDLEFVIEEVVKDYLLHGTIYFKQFWNSDKTKVIRFKRVEPSQVRLGVDPEDKSEINRVYHNLDWAQYGNFNTTMLPLFKAGNTNREAIEVFRFAKPNNALLYNTAPTYAAATNWINLDGEISTFHKSNIENSINPSLTIKFKDRPAPEEQRAIARKIDSQLTGARNAGKPLIIFGDGENAPEIEPVPVSNLDDQFNITADAIQRNICYAHKINPLIMGLKSPGSLGNSTELDTAFGIYTRGVIEPVQKQVESVINKLLKLKQLSVTFKFNEVKPLSKKED